MTDIWVRIEYDERWLVGGHFTILISQPTTPIGYSVSDQNQRVDLTTAVHLIDSPTHDPLLFGRFNVRLDILYHDHRNEKCLHSF
jgi:hypothetical protein